MNAVLTTLQPPVRAGLGDTGAQVDPVRRLLEPLVAMAESSDYLARQCVGTFTSGIRHHSLERFVFMGPRGGGDTIRLGIFAALRGDEPEGAEAAVEFLRQLEAQPELATGYHLFVYPICNPTGYEIGVPHSAGGRDLTAEFWRASNEPEIVFLERDLETAQFQGVIALRSARRVSGLRALTPSAILDQSLLDPARRAAEPFLPAGLDLSVEKLPSLGAACFRGVLSKSYELDPTPFEILLETPAFAPRAAQVCANVAALESILDSYRLLQGLQPNL